MKITEVQITPIKAKNGLIALASIVIDDNIYLGSIGIYTLLNRKGYRLTYPTKIISNKSINIYHPINKDVSRTIEEAIIKKVKEVLKNVC